jgi:hypothetical protein
VGHGGLDGAAQAVQVVGQVGGGQRGARGDHAAADIDRPRAAGMMAPTVGMHAADGRALAQVHVGHHRQLLVFVDEGQAGGVHGTPQLLAAAASSGPATPRVHGCFLGAA